MIPVELAAPAKLTTSLRISGVRNDGLHLIEAEMVTLDLADVLVLSAGSGVSYSGDHGSGIALGSDLVSKALGLLGCRARVEVTKNIPPGGGLGGGSADAAAMLRWGGFDDVVAAAGLGADVAFCLVGGRAKVTGIGEVVEPLPHVAQSFTLLFVPFGCSTAEVYRRWDELGGPRGSNGNDLEPAAVSYEPRLARWRELLGDATGQTPRLAGSGSTWFVDGAYPGEGRVVVSTVA